MGVTGRGSKVDATRVVVVDDHQMFVDSLVRLLSDEPDFVVVAVANTIAHGIHAIQSHHPDVLLLDFRLPDGDAPEFVTRLRDVAPTVRVLVMTGLGDESTMEAARNAGCAGVVTKDRAAHDLVDALRAVAAGVPVAGSGSALQSLPPSAEFADATLSAREREVLEQLATGQSTAEIASVLHISPVTVRNHIQRILPKLGAHSRLEAVALGIQDGIIAPPAPHRPQQP